MNKLFTKIAGLSIGLAMAIGVGVAVGSKEATSVYASPQTGFTPATMTAGTNGSTCTVNTYSGIKVGTSSKGGDMSITVPSGATKLVLYAAAWKGVTGLSLNITKTSGAASATISSSSISLTADSGISNNSPFTLSGTESSYRFDLTLTNITADTVYKFESSTTKRFVVWSAQTQAAETKVTATYVSTYGTLSKSSEQVNPGSSISMPTISNKPSTHEFEGFSDGTNTFAEGATTTISANTTFTAQWVEIKELTSIALSGTYPTSFDQGASFSHEGMVVTAHFGDSTSADVTSNATWSGYNMSTAGNQTVTVSYTLASITKTATYGITVNSLPQYELITSAEDLETGAKYVIGDSTKAHFMSSTQNSNNRGKIDLTPSNDILTYSDGLEVIELGGSAGSWTLYATKSDTKGYLYAAGANSNNYLRTKTESTTWTITFSDGTPTLVSAAATRGTMQYNASGMFACYGSASQVDVSLWKLVDTTESITISKNSVSGLKTDTDTSVSITVKNFTPTNISVSYSTAGVASITKGTISNKIIPLNVEFTGVGDTTATISVLGGKATYTCTLDISVTAKPASMTIIHSDIVAGHLEIKTGAFKQVSFSGLDTDGNPYSIAAGDVTGSITSGDSFVSLSGSRITGSAEGTAVVRYTLNVLTSIYAEVTIDVRDDYKTTVNSITFNSSLTATQGDSVNATEVFATKVANTHFGSTENIADSEFLYSYSNSRSGAEAYNVFSYDFSHGETVDSTHKSQTIYVFVTFDEDYSGNFTITVEQANDPLTAITLTNVTSHGLEVARGGSFQLEWAYTPTNPTDGKEVVFSVSENSNNIDITVSSLGSISIGSASNLGHAKVTIASAHDSSISDYVVVTATLESMTYVVSETESWSKAESISVGDEVIIVNETASRELTEVNNSHVGVATTYATEPSHSFVLTVGEGNSEGSFTLSNNSSYLAYTNTSTSKNNNLYTISNPTSDDELNQVSWTIEISDGDATITNVYNTNRQLQYNASSGQERFCCYVTSQNAVQIYKKSGGDTPYTVTETLFNGVHNNFGGEGATYEWDASCSNFDGEAWEDACDALKGITGYSTYKLNRAVGNIAGNEIEQFIAKYDIIIGKTSTEYDFLGRFSNGGINANTRIDVNPLQLSAKNTSAVIIIVITSSISIAAVGGYFLFRKKKEQ